MKSDRYADMKSDRYDDMKSDRYEVRQTECVRRSEDVKGDILPINFCHLHSSVTNLR